VDEVEDERAEEFSAIPTEDFCGRVVGVAKYSCGVDREDRIGETVE
jgi:hypothetical protein